MKKIVLRIISLAVTVIMLLSTMMMTSADKLSVTEEEYNKYDVVKKAAYNYYKEDFTLTLGEGYVRATTLESRPAGGALCVKPEEVNTWSVGKNNATGKTVTTSFKFMFPEDIAEGEQIKLFYIRAASDYLLTISHQSSGNVLSLNFGFGMSTVELEADEWYQINILMTERKAYVYCGADILGIAETSYAIMDPSTPIFDFNANAGDNTLTYYIDDIYVSPVGDGIFAKVSGYQKTMTTAEGEFNVRFIVTVGEVYEGQENIGADIYVASGTKEWNMYSNTAYVRLTSKFGEEKTRISTLNGGKYATTFTINEIPADTGKVEFLIKPYVTINGVRVYGTDVTIALFPITQ